MSNIENTRKVKISFDSNSNKTDKRNPESLFECILNNSNNNSKNNSNNNSNNNSKNNSQDKSNYNSFKNIKPSSSQKTISTGTMHHYFMKTFQQKKQKKNSENQNIVNTEEDLIIINLNPKSTLPKLPKLKRPTNISKNTPKNTNKKLVTSKSLERFNSFKNNLFKMKYKNDSLFDFNKSTIKIKKDNKNKNSPKTKKQIQNLPETDHKNQVTCYLNRKLISDLPITFPLFLSYNNNYKTFSEKNRVEKILNKFVCLKTHIVKDYNNKEKILREFMLKNGITDESYYSLENLQNFNNYLRKPFHFDSKKTIEEIITEAINYKSDNSIAQEDKNKMLPVNYYNNNSKKNSFIKINTNKIKRKNNSSDSKTLNANRSCELINNRVESKYCADEKHMLELVNELEKSLQQIKAEGNIRINKLNSLKSPQKFEIIDKNKFVPNLCLVNDGLKEQYKYIINKENRKLRNSYNRQLHIKHINERMYYDNVRKKNSAQSNYTDEIRRKLKLTEFIIVQRTKRKLFYQQGDKFLNAKIKNKTNIDKSD